MKKREKTSGWKSDTIVVNKIKLRYYRTGGDKLPLVLAHGITDNGLCWAHLAEILQEHYDVIMFDARGHGRSEQSPPDFSPESHAADLAGLSRALKLSRPVVMGHSMGAANAAIAAATYPDLARVLILEDPPWKEQFSAQEQQATIDTWKNDLRELQTQELEQIKIDGADENPRWSTVNWPAWAEAKHQVNPEVVEWIRSDKPFVGWRTLLPEISCPVLLITGDPALGALVTPEIAEKAAALSDHLEIAHIEGAGHSIRREQFEEYVSMVGRFLRFL